MPDWGANGLNDKVTKTNHAAPYNAIDPSTVKLPKPFVVCVVGASRGIGAGICHAYAKAGASGLILASRRVSGLEATGAEVRKINPETEVEIVPCDITQADSVAALAEKARAKYGRLDVAVMNSGYSGPLMLKITDTDPETFQNATNVNYVGTFLCAKYLIPLLLDTKDGAKALIAVNSIASLIVRGPLASSQYCVSKMAQLKLMEHIHEEYVEEGLASFSVHPGAVVSEMAAESIAEEFKSWLTDSPDLCGAFCVWLTKEADKRCWLSGRLVSAKWDVTELEGMKDKIVERDLFKIRATV